ASRQDFQRLDKELADALAAREHLRLLGAELAPVARLKEEVAALERLQRETAARRTEEAQLAELARNIRMLERRLTELGDVPEAPLEVIPGDGKYFRQRLEQLAPSPGKLLDAEAERDRVLEESRGATARAGELRAQLEERDRASAELAGARRRAAEVERRLTARPAGYDAARHDAVRAELAKLEPVALEAAALEERARRAERLVQEAERAEQQLSTGEHRVRELTDAVRAEGFSDAEYRQAKDRYDRGVGALRELEMTEDDTLTILERRVPKPVISGGEEDIASLVLRLAISQMIAERAGQPLSLLVIDEIFGSLDEARRLHVVGLLRRLADRFPQ